MDIILATPPEALPLFRALHNFHVGLTPHIYHAHGADRDFLAHLDSAMQAGGWIYGHDAGWGLVSYMLVLPETVSADAMRHGGRRMKIDHLYIAPTHRGRGLGQALIGRLEQDMRRMSLRHWVVAQDGLNHGATGFYRAVGGQPKALMHEKWLSL